MNINLLFQALVLLFSVILHEFAHGWAAYRLGDPTAKDAGRLTLNPIPHIDPIGTIVLPLLLIITRAGFVFGWAKPVPINSFYFKDPRKGIMLTSAAGPLSNLCLAFIGGLLFRSFLDSPQFISGNSNFALLLVHLVFLNVLLAIFNLLPIPPLDGSHILSGFLPERLALKLSSWDRYGMILLFIFIMTPAFDKLLIPLVKSLSLWLIHG